MRPESGCRPPAEVSTVQALMDLVLPRFAGLGDGPRQVHPPWSIASDSPASPAACRLDKRTHVFKWTSVRTPRQYCYSSPRRYTGRQCQPGYVVNSFRGRSPHCLCLCMPGRLVLLTC